MIVDFQHHFTPRELIKEDPGTGKIIRYDDQGVPSYSIHSLLWDLDEHIRMMDVAGIDVAEIDPAVKRAANRALYLPPDDETAITTYTMDARNLVDDLLRDGAADSYDFIFGDAFNDLSVPYHLTTLEFTAELGELLKPDGVYMINIIDIYAAGLGRFLGSFVGTSMQNFAYVYVFSTSTDGPNDERDTFIVACSMLPLDIHDLGGRPGDDPFEGLLFAWAENGVLGGEMETVLERSGGLILTDDFAPVDNLLAPILSGQ